MKTAYITHADCLRHEMGAGHPECPDRLTAVNEEMRSSGLLDELRSLEAPLASADDLKRVHRTAYVDTIFENAPAEGYVQLERSDVGQVNERILRGSSLRPSRDPGSIDGVLHLKQHRCCGGLRVGEKGIGAGRCD
jgi:acetoin utilization deacetylase AcuC-like enzyme